MTETGPRCSDAEFFGEQLNLRFPGMEEVSAAAAAEDYPAARKAYAAYIRSHLRPERISACPTMDRATALCWKESVSGNPPTASAGTDWFPAGFPMISGTRWTGIETPHRIRIPREPVPGLLNGPGS